jgi:GPH family glycoside/pentoside/hexuronide:cation symporter
MDASETAHVKVSDLWMELVRNRPLRVLSIFFIIAFTTTSISNAADSYFMSYNIGATPLMTTVFMWLGTIPAFVFLPLLPAIKKRIGKAAMFRLFLLISIGGMLLMYVIVSAPQLAKCFPLICVVQFVKSVGVLVATGYMWALVPEVIEHSERLTGRRLSAVISSIMGIFFRLGMAVGKILPGIVLAWTGYRGAATEESAALPSDPCAWLCAMGVFAFVAAAALLFSFLQTK